MSTKLLIYYTIIHQPEQTLVGELIVTSLVLIIEMSILYSAMR